MLSSVLNGRLSWKSVSFQLKEENTNAYRYFRLLLCQINIAQIRNFNSDFIFNYALVINTHTVKSLI